MPYCVAIKAEILHLFRQSLSECISSSVSSDYKYLLYEKLHKKRLYTTLMLS